MGDTKEDIPSAKGWHTFIWAVHPVKLLVGERTETKGMLARQKRRSLPVDQLIQLGQPKRLLVLSEPHPAQRP